MPVFEQTFGQGMVQDIDPHLQPADTYRLARNGRILSNPDQTNIANGKSLAFMQVVGNKLFMALRAGYEIIGFADCRQGTVVFSTNGIDSEIGLWEWDTETNNVIVGGPYRTLYNDACDPNIQNNPYSQRLAGQAGQDRLNWRVTDSIDCEVAYENEQTERIYWTNRRGTKYTLNLRDAPANTYPLPDFYPKHWSVHAFRERSDTVFPLLKLLGRGKGRLLSGTYQIAVQYRAKNGQRSVFSPVTLATFVTANPLDAYLPNGSTDATLQSGLRMNHHNRTMSASGKMTTESLRWELKNLDVRWEEISVAVLYYKTAGQPETIVLMPPVTIGRQTSVTVEITDLAGEEISIAELSQRYETVLKVGTLAAHDNRLIEGNLSMLRPIGIDTKSVSFRPKLVNMWADNTEEPLFQNKANPVTKRNDGDPFTNSPVVTGSVLRQLFGNVSESYGYTNDYANYKGQVWSHLFGGYFRGETYEFAAVVLDRLGQPMFAIPAPAYTFPEQYSSGPNGETDYYTLTDKDSLTNKYYLKIMGLVMSGLKLPAESLYDEDGRLNVSGFMIVRRKRKQRILHQGILVPGCFGPNCRGDQDQEDSVWPLPTANNFFARDTVGFPDSFYHPEFKYYCWRGNKSGLPIFSRPYFGIYHSPDVLIEESLKTLEAGDDLHHVGVVRSAYSTGKKGKGAEMFPAVRHFYTKAVRTATTGLPFTDYARNGRPNLGERTRLSLSLLHSLGFDETYKEFDRDNLNQLFETQSHPFLDSGNSAYPWSDGLLQRNAALFKLKDWTAVDIAESQANPCSYRVVNYRQAVGPSSEEEPYLSTGHFQPVTQTILSQAGKVFDQNGQVKYYVFDNVEVWGGDCFVNLFDFTRIYPFYSDNCDKRKGDWPDYSHSMILPVESKYNIALRTGRGFAANSIKPEQTSCEGNPNQFSNGINAKQPEDWNFNKALLADTSVVPYAVQPRDTTIITERPNGFSWTPRKSAGQLLDNWRMRLVGDYGEVDGSLGSITKFSKASFQGLYCWQEHGFCAIPLDASSYQSADSGIVLIQSGATFRGTIPLSKKYGTQHPDSVWELNGQMGAWDARMGVLIRHSQAGFDLMSQSDNLDDFTKALTLPVSAGSNSVLRSYECVSGVDIENGEVLVTVRKGNVKHTAVYSVSRSAFTGFYDVYPKRYANRGRLLISVNPARANQISAHNRGRYGEWYGEFFPTTLTFIVNPMPTANKTFDNGDINTVEASVNRISGIVHSTPNGGPAQVHSLVPAIDERFRFWHNSLSYPMHEEDWDDVKQRLRDHYMQVDITIVNDAANIAIPVTSFRTKYRISE